MENEETNEIRANTSKRDAEIESEITKKLNNLIAIAKCLPTCGDNYELCHSFSMFNDFMSKQEHRVHELISRCMKNSGCPVAAPKTGDELNSYISRIVRANDAILERVGICMQEIEKAHREEEIKMPATIIGAESVKTSSKDENISKNFQNIKPMPSNLPALLKSAREQREIVKMASISRPQRDFNIVVDNTREPFVSKLKIKHHTRKTRSNLIVVDLEKTEKIEEYANLDVEVTHPYRSELDRLKIPERQLESEAPGIIPPLEDYSIVLVNTKEGLQRLLDTLNNEIEFAVDLEHNDIRSFLGITCLIQISTRSTDYIIDPFPIWNELGILNEPFTNPGILKVFHGADLDILWLQRDFGIHVVNMFDTYHAMKRLELTKFSLQYLVQNYCGLTLNKQYQTSDWRLRPLTEDQIQYARSDTHYLLYCYDRCREDLLLKGNEFKNLLKAVYYDSVSVCGKIYAKPVFDPVGYINLLNAKRTFNSQQEYALRELWKWRDNIARAEDEGLNYVLPNHMMLYIAEALPREAQGIAACCNPVPEMVKKHVLDIHKIVYLARDQPLVLRVIEKKKILGEEGSFLQALIDEQNRMTKIKSLLKSNLDFSHTRFDEETGSLKVRKNDIRKIPVKLLKDSFFSFLHNDTGRKRVEQSEGSKFSTMNDILQGFAEWATPFERYTIGVKKATEQAERQMQEKRIKIETGEKKRFTHHDPSAERCSQNISIEENTITETKEELQQQDNLYSDDQILTKKALARKRKHARQAADIKLDDKDVRDEIDDNQNEKESLAKRRKSNAVDYSKYSDTIFNQRPSNDEFDPFQQQTSSTSKKNKKMRGRGGHHRMGRQSTGYMPQKK